MSRNYPNHYRILGIHSLLACGLFISSCGRGPVFQPTGIYQELPQTLTAEATYTDGILATGSTSLTSSEGSPFVVTVGSYDSINNVIGNLSVSGDIDLNGVVISSIPLDLNDIGLVTLSLTHLQIPGYAGCDIQFKKDLGLHFGVANILDVTLTKTYTFTTMSTSQTCHDLFDNVADAVRNGTPLNPPFDIAQAAGVLTNLLSGEDISTLQIIKLSTTD